MFVIFNLVNAFGDSKLILLEMADGPPNKAKTRGASKPIICLVVSAGYWVLVRAAMLAVGRFKICEEVSA